MRHTPSILQLAGIGLVSAAAWIVSVPAGLTTTGLAAILVGVVLERN